MTPIALSLPDELIDAIAERVASRVSTAAPAPIALSVDATAALLGLSPRTVDALIAAGDLPSFKVGARRLVRRDAAEEWARRKEAAERPPAGRDDLLRAIERNRRRTA